MARPLRPLVADGVYHVAARGNDKRPIYADDHDRRMFLGILARTIDRFDWRALSYCLMGNHFHLLLRTPHPNLDRGMQQLKSTYAQRFNARHGHGGHLFGGRYRAVLVQRDAHLLEVLRYIALNPVREDLCKHPADWPWSAHRALAGLIDPPRFLATGEALGYVGGRADPRTYAEFVASAAEAEYRPIGVVYGDEEFKRQHLPDRRPSDEIAERDWGEGRPALERLLNGEGDLEAIGRAYRIHGYPLAAIAATIGCHVSTISRRLRRYEDEVLESKI